MWKDIRAFYASKEWQLARLEAIMRATNDKGQIIDEYNGEVIINTYDIQVHHKIELTLSNVNDYNISLNLDNLLVVSRKSHNEIHERFGYTQKKVYLVFGSPCSGKSSYVKSIAGRNDIILDVDSLYQAISINDRYNKPKSISPIALALRETILEQITMRNFIGNAYVISTEARILPRERLFNRINADEYIYIERDREECISNLYNDEERLPYIQEQLQYIDKFFNQLQLE